MSPPKEIAEAENLNTFKTDWYVILQLYSKEH